MSNNNNNSSLPRTNHQFDDNSKNIGVLYTGYLEKKNPVGGAFKKRFVVLTNEAIHWYYLHLICFTIHIMLDVN